MHHVDFPGNHWEGSLGISNRPMESVWYGVGKSLDTQVFLERYVDVEYAGTALHCGYIYLVPTPSSLSPCISSLLPADFLFSSESLNLLFTTFNSARSVFHPLIEVAMEMMHFAGIFRAFPGTILLSPFRNPDFPPPLPKSPQLSQYHCRITSQASLESFCPPISREFAGKKRAEID